MFLVFNFDADAKYFVREYVSIKIPDSFYATKKSRLVS